MKRLLPLLVLALGCATSSPPADLPTWSPQRRQAQGNDHIFLQALILEVPARGLPEVRSGPLEMGVLNAALGTPGARVLQSPNLVTTPDSPAELFVGEMAAGETVGLRLAVENKGSGDLSGTFLLTDLDKNGEPYKVAEASFDLKVGDSPLQVEIPGQRFVPGGDEIFFQDRVFLIVIEASKE